MGNTGILSTQTWIGHVGSSVPQCT
uniref:Uncharacterized protein n=1 Tax=Anguilla anguilla TaxID=7936 RepID=A0A0E9SAD8_ANGAN